MVEEVSGIGRLEEVVEEINPVLAPLGRTFRRMFSAFEREVGISPPHYFMLRVLAEEDGISQGEIGRLFEVDPSRITRLAKVLEAGGLIERLRDPLDNRVVRMSLTSKGREEFEQASGGSEVFKDRVRDALGEDGIEDLKRLLTALAEAINEPEGER